MSYIEWLPIELRNIIASYYILENNDVKTYIKTLNILNIKDYRSLYNITYPEYYEVTLDELPYFSKTEDNIYLRLLIFIPKLMKYNDMFGIISINYFNIIYRYKVKQQFPGLYKLMKNFDLSKGGVVDTLNYVYLADYYHKKNYDYPQWNGLYFRLNHINEEDHLTDILLKFLKSGDLPINYVYDSTEDVIAHSDFIVYLFYAMAFHPNFKFELQPINYSYSLLLSSHWYNEDVYLKLREIIPNKIYKDMLNDQEIIRDIQDIYNEETERTKDIPLVEYIKNRAK